MSIQQMTKVRLSPFNTAKYDIDSMDFDALSGTSGAIDNGAGYAKGAVTFVADGSFIGGGLIDGMLISFAGHNQEYYVTSTSPSGGSKNVNIEPALVKAVTDNELFYVLQPTDITDCAIDISDLEYEIEVNQNELVLDKQVRIRLFNFENTFYDRTTFTSAYEDTAALFTSRNTQDGVDNKYISILIYNTVDAAWYQIYAGQIVREELILNEPKAEIRFICESVFYGFNDIRLDEVEDVFNGHYFTSSTRQTKSVSGRYMDLLTKIFHTIGVPKKYHDVTSREKNSGQCKIGFTTDPEIISGEYIEIPDSMGSDYAGKFRCDGAETISGTYYIYYQFGTNTVAVNNSDVADGCIAHRVYFDKLEDFYEYVTIGDQVYSFEDAWFICEKWYIEEISLGTIKNFLDDVHATFLAYSNISFLSGKIYAFFRSKNNSSYVKTTLGQDDFIGDAEIQGNWRFFSQDSIEIKCDVKYYNDESRVFNFAYLPDLYSYKCTITEAGTDIINLDIADPTDILENGNKIKFENDDTIYRIVDSGYAANQIQITPKLRVSLKNDMRFFKLTNDSISLKYASMFKIKSKFPIFYFANTGDGTVKKLTNTSNNIGDYDYYTLLSAGFEDAAYGVAVIQNTAWCGVSERPFGHCLVFTTATASDYRAYYLNVIYTIESPLTVGANKLKDGTVGLGPAFCISCDYVNAKDEDSPNNSLLIGFFLNTQSQDIARHTIEILNQGDYNDVTGGNSWDFMFSKLETKNPIYTDSGALITSGVLTLGIQLNSSILNPDYDDYLYFADSGATPEIEKVPAYASTSRTVVVTLSGIGGSNVYGLTINHGNDDTMQTLYFGRDNNGTIYRNDDAAFTTFSVLCGGGATSPTLGNSTNDLSLNSSVARSLWKCYDPLLAITDYTANKIFLYDEINDLAYCIADSTSCDSPYQITGIDFIDDPQVLEYSVDRFENIATRVSKLHYDYYSKDRRIVRASLRWQDIDYLDIGLGDRVALDSTVIADETYGQTIFWISKLVFNWETHEYDIEFLEDTDAQQGIGAMIIGQDNKVA